MKPGSSLTGISLLNDWSLFWLIFAAISLVLVATMLQVDLSASEQVSRLIALSVKVSVPWLYLAFAASSLAYLVRNDFTRWLLRNRRMLGLSYAAGMAWQAVFIVWLVTGHFDYYTSVAENPYDLAEELPGYIFLLAMVPTSFNFCRKKLTPRQWRWLHTVGIYYLWGETWSTYWYYSYYYEDPQFIYHLYYWAGLVAWGLRITAWSQRRRQMHRVAEPA